MRMIKIVFYKGLMQGIKSFLPRNYYSVLLMIPVNKSVKRVTFNNEVQLKLFLAFRYFVL